MSLFIPILVFALLHLLLLFTPSVEATYALKENYSGKDFFDGFDFFTDADPTHGFVTYVDRETAEHLKLVDTETNGASYMGVDSSTGLNPNGPGRKSVRIESRKSWTHGLFIADITHMPGGICGTWPAYWTLGPDWPNNGEIDIIEGVNSQQGNILSLHTSRGCTVAGDLQLGTLQTSNCDADANFNSGCSSSAVTKTSYGEAFNENGGGVFATEWTSDYIRIWFFPRGFIPADILDGKPRPRDWGLPEVNFQGDCSIDKKFKDHKLIFDTTFCGDWGNSVWAADDICGRLAPNCEQYVATKPGAFVDASWTINYVKVFQQHRASGGNSGHDNYPRSASACSEKSSISPTGALTESTEPSMSSEELPTVPTSWHDIPAPSNTPYLDSMAPLAIRDSPVENAIEDVSELFFPTEPETDAIMEHPEAPTSPPDIMDPPARDWDIPSTEIVDPCEEITTDIETTTHYATPTISKKPESKSFAYGMGSGAKYSQYYTKVVTTTYVDICKCKANTLTTHTITSTISLCSCFHPQPFITTEPRIPMYTTVRECYACGEESVITVTIPYPEVTTTEDSQPIIVFTTETVVPYPSATGARDDREVWSSDGIEYLQVNQGNGAVGEPWGLVVLAAAAGIARVLAL